MAQPFVGEIQIFGGNFAPNGWAFCNGAILDISQNSVLFTLIGTTYGGDGVNTFALPDLRGRVPVCLGTGPDAVTYVIGQTGGTESVTLTVQAIPSHTHAPFCNTGAGNSGTPGGSFWAGNASTALPQFAAAPDTNMNAAGVGNTGGSQPHENLMPYVAVNFIISLFGIFPSQN